MRIAAGSASNPFGEIVAPNSVSGINPEELPGNLIDMGIKILIVGAMIYSVFNLVLAGYDFISAADDTKKVASAWSRIYQTILGLAVAAGALVLAAIFSQLIFGDFTTILQPKLPTLK